MRKVDYGGAYDILPDQYWTRDDLTELENTIQEIVPKSVKICGSYIENDVATIVYHDSEECEWEVASFIDKRVAGTTKELSKKYGPRLSETILAGIKDRVIERILNAMIDNKDGYLKEIGYTDDVIHNRDEVSFDLYHHLELADNDFIARMCEKYQIPCDFLEKESAEIEL